MFKKEFKELKEINSQESKIELGFIKKNSKIKDTSIEKIEKSKSKPRNISLPNLKKKPSNRDNRRLKMHKRKTKMNGLCSKYKGEKWGDLFFHYFEEIVDRFVAKKLELKNKNANGRRSPVRGRLFSEDIDHWSILRTYHLYKYLITNKNATKELIIKDSALYIIAFPCFLRADEDAVRVRRWAWGLLWSGFGENLLGLYCDQCLKSLNSPWVFCLKSVRVVKAAGLS